MTDGEAPHGAPGEDRAAEEGARGGQASKGPATGTAPTGPELRRDDNHRVLAGVCTGLGKYTRIDPVVWRAAFALTAFAGGVGLLLYIAAWMLMRDPQGSPATFEQLLNRSIPPHTAVKLLTLGLAAATALSLVGGFGWGTLVLAIPLVLGLLTARNRGVDLRASLLALRSEIATHEPPPTGPVPQPTAAYYNPAQPWASAPQGPVDLAVVSERTSLGSDGHDEDDEEDDEDEEGGDEDGKDRDREPYTGDGHRHGTRKASPLASHALWTVVAMAIVVGVAAQYVHPSLAEMSSTQLLFGPETGPFFMAAAVAVIGLFALVGTWAGNPRGLMPLGTFAVLAAVLVASVDVTAARIGDGDWRPATVAEAESGDMRLNVGSGTLDLTELAAGLEPGESVDVASRVDVGHLDLVLPEDARVNVVSEVRCCQVEAPAPDGGSEERNGMSVTYEQTFEPTGSAGPAEDADGREDTGETGETEETGEGSVQDEVPVINVRTDMVLGKVEVQYG